MKKTVLIILTICLFLHSAGAGEVLKNKDFLLEAELKKEHLILNISAKTTGWLAIVIDAGKGMKGGNVLVGWVDDALGIAMGNDCYGSSVSRFKNDMLLGGEENMLILSGAQDKERTKISFSLPLDSGDKYDKALARGESYSIRLYGAKTDNLKDKPFLKAEGTLTIP